MISVLFKESCVLVKTRYMAGRANAVGVPDTCPSSMPMRSPGGRAGATENSPGTDTITLIQLHFRQKKTRAHTAHASAAQNPHLNLRAVIDMHRHRRHMRAARDKLRPLAYFERKTR